MDFTWCMIVFAVLVGHFGLNLAIYNRVNALGWSRKTIKRIVKVFFAFTILFPIGLLVFYHDLVWDLLRGRPDSIPIPAALQLYGWLCLSSWVFLGIPWLLWRPIFGLEWIKIERKIDVIAVDEALGRSLSLTKKCRWESRLPLNQIFELSIEQIELPVVGLPPELDGYRIAQISDIHLTGDVHSDFSRFVVERANKWRPDLMAITGDIIDNARCIDWLSDIFARAVAPDGCYYVLGNHDTRIIDSAQTREAMDRAGWTDLGSRGLHCELWGVRCLLIGNEHPWYRRPDIDPVPQESFRLMLSHSPDQLQWARRHNVNLMLAGHTHGGQGRLPLAGPLLSPSFHGSRYASGDFLRPPTTMHVTRGLSGTHLLRINCRPELSLLVLRHPRHVAERT